MIERQNRRTVRSFARREGRMTAAQRLALDRLWMKYGLRSADGAFDCVQAFGSAGPLFLDIGFGMGESLLSMAKSHPENCYIGVEVYRPGVGTLLSSLEANAIANARVYNEDATYILNRCLGDESLNGIYLFFPDPWPKRRHHKRRLINVDFVTLAHRKLKTEGFIHVATDWEDYANQIMKVMIRHSGFSRKKMLSTEQGERPLTKYERRGLRLGHQVWDLCFAKADPV